MRGKSFRVQLPGEILDRRNDARRRPIHSFTDQGKMAVSHGVQSSPPRPLREDIEIILTAFGMGFREDQELRLETNDFLEAHLRPVLRGVHDGCSAGMQQGIGNESVPANGDERIRPNDKENSTRRDSAEVKSQVRQATLEIRAESEACLRDAEYFSKALCRRNDLLNSVGIGGVRRDAEVSESVDRFEAVQTLGNENEIGAQGNNLFKAGINSAAYLGFLLRIRWVIAEVRVSDQPILQTQGVYRLGQAGGERNDALNRLRDANAAPDFIHEILVGWSSRWRLGLGCGARK